jgi:hypothetical protein
LRYRGTLDGVVLVNDVPVTGANGWIEVALYATATARGAPSELSVRIRVGADSEGYPFLYAEQVEIGGRRYGGVHALVLAEGSGWVTQLMRGIHDEISRRVAHAAHVARVPTPVRTSSRPIPIASARMPTIPAPPLAEPEQDEELREQTPR